MKIVFSKIITEFTSLAKENHHLMLSKEKEENNKIIDYSLLNEK